MAREYDGGNTTGFVSPANGSFALAYYGALRRGLLEEVPLSPDERAAAEGDMAALDGMLAKLREVPALDGRTPHEINSDRDRPT